MKAFLSAQFNPRKSMEQLIDDRTLYRSFILAMILMAVCG
jgi:hypothetical protein